LESGCPLPRGQGPPRRGRLSGHGGRGCETAVVKVRGFQGRAGRQERQGIGVGRPCRGATRAGAARRPAFRAWTTHDGNTVSRAGPFDRLFPQKGSLCWNSCVSSKQRLHRGELRKLVAGMVSGRSQLERGEGARIARELGCSRERVRQIMGELGVTTKPPLEPQSCTGCGKAMSRRKTRLCQSCRRKNVLVSLKCANCGRTFKRRRKEHEAYLRRTVVKRRWGPVCSKQCSAKVTRSCSWCGRSAGNRRRAHVATHAFCGRPRTCLHQAQTTIAPMRWHYMTADLLPMKDHLDGIARLRATLASRSRVPR
jgi:hypothetical protein